ncbi:UDP-glucose dehydrogenase family protein [Hugenholtzia roseola]|uniref:UDP-glucose dehydrogenase family protein n=1 Tax=Hugenholtzia roseola TaxID=1002 RepID=UPI0004285191|nr:UDP-glucose/GDP-mannose dehydrogenase family protein [Hugenholtzia roseola]
MRIAVIGTGYVGLVTGVCFAEKGNQVICVDIDQAKLARLRKGECPIYEPDLDTLLEKNIAAGRLHFTDQLAEAVAASTLIFLALPTPPGGDGAADLSFVLGVSKEIGKILNQLDNPEMKVIVDKSTVPVGTADKVRALIAAETQAPFAVISNPEFLREGFAVEDFMKPDRVVVGTDSAQARKLMYDLYAPYCQNPQGQILFMDERSAEMTKYAANSYLAMRISFMNEIANLCEKLDANVDAVKVGIGSDTRIGSKFLNAGIGYGGSCFPKDVQALAQTAQEQGYDFKILKSVMQVNAAQRLFFVEKIKSYFQNQLAGKTIAVWGLAFKPNTDDIREAPALDILKALLEMGVKVRTHDPEAMPAIERIFGKSIVFCQDPYQALENADALAILTEWKVFQEADLNRMASLLKAKVIFDGRNIYDLAQMQAQDWHYESMGRQKVVPLLRPQA